MRYRPDVTIVVGPPGSGKSYYIEQHRGDGDLVIDYDALMAALTGKPLHEHYEPAHWLVYTAIESMVRRLCQGDIALRVWIPVASRMRAARLRHQLGGSVVTMETNKETCMERLRTRNEPMQGSTAVEEWFRGE